MDRGDAAPSLRHCRACGAAPRAGLRFCTGCGAALVDSAPPAEEAAALVLARLLPGAAAGSVPQQPAATTGITDDARRYASVAGPVDRATFYEEQRRHRQATWRHSAVCLLASAVMGLPLSLVVTPFLILLTLLAARVLGVEHLPGAQPWREALATLDRWSAGGAAGTDGPAWWEVVAALGVLAAPGAVVLVLLWLAMAAVFGRAGSGGVLLTLGARPPRAGDFEEEQLCNVVEEMAVAAGMRPPRVMLLDTPVPNAAVLGSSHADACVVVARSLLDDLDRDETQGVLAHLLASAGNGDLGVLARIMAVLQTFGLVQSLGDAVFFRAASGAPLISLLRFLFTRRDAVAADAVNRILARAATDIDPTTDPETLSEVKRPEPEPHQFHFRPGVNPLVFTAGQVCGVAGVGAAALVVGGWLAPDVVPPALRPEPAIALGLIGVAFFALMVGALLMAFWGLLRFLLWVYTGLLVIPMLAITWRSRRYLADATAVQLTRYPDGLARALTHLVERGGVIPGTEWAAHLFVTGNEAAATRLNRYGLLAQRRARAAQHQGALSTQDRQALAREVGAMLREQRRSYRSAAGMVGGTLSTTSFHPPLWRRLLRLKALGATIPVEDWSKEARRRAFTCGCAALAAGGVVLLIAGAIIRAAASGP
jgi:Zn-dependent protease with chaperone function